MPDVIVLVESKIVGIVGSFQVHTKNEIFRQKMSFSFVVGMKKDKFLFYFYFFVSLFILYTFFISSITKLLEAVKIFRFLVFSSIF